MTEQTTKTGRWKNWLLIASLALNLAIVGIIAGFALRGDTGRKGPPRGVPNDMVRELVRAVPESQREALREDLSAKREEMQQIRHTVVEGRSELVRVLVAPDFDISRVVAILDNHRVILSRITSGGHELIIRRIENMSPEERQIFAKNLRKFHESRRYRK